MGWDRMSYTQPRRFTTRRNRSDRRGAAAGAAAIAAVLVTLALGACASAPDLATRETFDHRGKRRLEAPMVAVELETGAHATLSSPLIPGITFGGVVSGDEREFSLYVTEARLFGNWANGWTEGFYEASGVVVFSRAGAAWRVRVEDPLELWSLESGGIRYYDSYILGEEGASKVRVRVDRLEAYADWFRGSAGESFYGDSRREGAYGGGLVPAFEAALAAAGVESPPDPGDEAPGGAPPSSGSSAAGGTPLPEGLARLRESDTIDRDLREAPSLFVAIYNLEHFTGSVLDGAVLYNQED